MRLGTLDYVIFAAYLAITIAVGLYLARKEDDTADYFLAGRALRWWIIGASLIATNISTEHFVGMAGSGYRYGLAIASYEWMAAITLVLVGWWFLPTFLRHGIYTMPQFLEVRFNAHARGVLALYLLLAYIFVALATVIYSGALALSTLFGIPVWVGIALLCGVTGLYTIYGGLKAVVFTDFVQFLFLIAGGAVTLVLGLRAIGGVGKLLEIAPEKFHTVLPLSHPELPWFGVFFGGLWIANLFYWGCNQYITQRTLAARSLREGQHGILFAAAIKVILPFLIVLPGIIAWALYHDRIANPDTAYPFLITAIVPTGVAGLIFAGLLAAVMSTLSSMINSSATIFTMDLYRRYSARGRAAGEAQLIRVGRWSGLAVLVCATLWAPMLGRVGAGVFHYIQEFWGIITPGVCVVFLLGLFWPRATARGAVTGLLITVPITVGVKLLAPGMAFLNQMLIAGLAVAACVAAVSLRDAPPPVVSASGGGFVDLTPSPRYWIFAGLIVAAVIGLYAVFF
jgi:solute:Na+ symporter, SSS family